MTINRRLSGGVAILDVRGRMVIEVLEDRVLVERVRRLLAEGQTRILLNLEGVSYVDTMGLCNIVEAFVATERQGGALKLVRVPRHLRELLVVTRLETILEAFDSEAEAVASVGAQERWEPRAPTTSDGSVLVVP